MKILYKKNIFLLFIYIYIIKISSENEQRQLERFKNAINLIISRANGIIDKTSLTFEYEKYNITLNNMKILKPFNKGIKIIKEKNENETFLNVSNVMLTIQCDKLIQLFTQKEEKIKYRDIFFESYFNEIQFKLINNYHIELSSSNIESINYINLDNLEYFSDFNSKKKCIFYEEEKEPIILEYFDSKLKEIFKNKFEEKIKETQKSFNLLTYDMIQLFDNYHFNETVTDYSLSSIFLVEPQKIKLEENNINLDLQKNCISIKNFVLTGIYLYLGETFFNFKMECQNGKEHLIYERNEKGTKIEFFLSGCSITDNNGQLDQNYYDEIKKILQDYYINYLKESAEKYYKDIFE